VQELATGPLTRLRWSVKESFVGYVRASGGVVRPEPGDGGEFVFRRTSDDTRLAFEGEATFEAHHGMLQVRLTDPELELTGTTGSLSVRDHADPDAGGRLTIARVQVVEMGPPVRLGVSVTTMGSRLFGDVYPPGEALDPIVLDTN
jgi:hypothetical protein